MNREVIMENQGISIIALFIIATSIVLPVGASAKTDVWLAVLLGAFFTIPVIWMYARLLSHFEGENVFDICVRLFGNVLGKFFCILFAWFAFYLAALVQRNLTEFFSVVGLDETPELIPALFFIGLCIWGVKEGIETLGRFALFYLPIIMFLIIVTICLLIPKMHITNMQPIAYEGAVPIIKGAFDVFTFPFAETVVFMGVFSYIKSKYAYYKVFAGGWLIGGLLLLMTTATDLLVLGIETYSSIHFPTYTAVSRVNVGDIIQRIEIVVSIVFYIGGFIKIAVCLLAASKGISKVFNIENYRPIVTPIGLLSTATSFILYQNIFEMEEWVNDVWPYYSVVFEIVLVLVIFIAAEIYVYRKKKQTGNPSNPHREMPS